MMSTPVLVISGLFVIALSIRLLRTYGVLRTRELRTHFTKWEMRVLLTFVIAFLLYAGKLRYEEHQDWNNRIGMPIVAEAYVWPEGCKEKDYKSGDEISSICKSEVYYMRSERKYYWKERPDFGLPYSVRPRYYYRIGNSAIEIMCPPLDIGDCEVGNIQKNTFTVKTDD
jgi:hypothetical protein